MSVRTLALTAPCCLPQIILVASGAIGIGTGKLNEQAMLSRSLRSTLHMGSSQSALMEGIGRARLGDRISPQASAAAGQGGLMGLYEALFQQYGLSCGQVLVTERDFANQSRLKRMHNTLEQILNTGAVPVLNENDVLSIPAKRSLFQDNDSLAVLVAESMQAELLLLFSDVAGIYKKPPVEGQTPEVLPFCTRSTPLNFGSKSARGRGGMKAKVDAALDAVDKGVGAVVILSGFEPHGLLRVLKGEPLGTLLISEAEAAELKPLAAGDANTSPEFAAALSQARGAREASRQLQRLSAKERCNVLLAMADALESEQAAIARANERDIAAAAEMNMSVAMAARLKLPPKKLKGVADGIRQLARQEDPLFKTKRHLELAPGLELRQETVPIGVLLVIFESRPDVVPQVSALAIASGNGLLLKGGKEAVHTNACLHGILAKAVERVTKGKVGQQIFGLVETRGQIAELLKLDHEIDLVIPRGSNSMVQSIMQSTRIPTLGHADGVCHMYVDVAADLARAEQLMVDAKTDYPAACNALETLLVHEAHLRSKGAAKLVQAARTAGIQVFGGPRAAPSLGLTPAEDMHFEYGDKRMAIEIVKDVNEAIAHINRYGSSHSDVIVTRDQPTAELFLKEVDSANVLQNASSRFVDGFRFGLGAEVGISTGRIHARGPVGVEGLLTTRNRVVSTSAHLVGDFSSGRQQYTHRDLMHSRL